jgi:hypothetical protein
MLLSGMAYTAALSQTKHAFAMPTLSEYASLNTRATSTKICLRVIARDGKVRVTMLGVHPLLSEAQRQENS